MLRAVWHLLIPLFLGIVFALCFVAEADPVELHARREVQRRQQVDNSSIAITSSSSPIVVPTTSTILPSSTAIDSSTPVTSNSAGPSSTPSAPDSSSITTPITSLSHSVRTFTTGIVTTVDGVATTLPATFTSATDVPVTLLPGLQEDTSSGLSDNNKKVVIGVIVGVGGAALIAGIAVVVWRHMKRQRDRKESNANLTYFSDDPVDGYGTAPTEGVVGSEKPEYRSPPVNAAANF